MSCSRSQTNQTAFTNRWMSDLFELRSRSLFVGVTFAATAVVMVILGQTPEKSILAWGFVILTLLLLSALSGLAVTFWETRQR